VLLHLLGFVAGSDFPHIECYNIYGEATGIPIRKGDKPVGIMEGFSMDGGTFIDSSPHPIMQGDSDSNDVYPIPDECFSDKSSAPAQLKRAGFHYELEACSTGRSDEDMLKICATICFKVSGCTSFHFGGRGRHCVLANTSIVPCGYYPERAKATDGLPCSIRDDGYFMGIKCPEQPLVAQAYSKRNTEPAPTIPMITWKWGQQIAIDVDDVGLDCELIKADLTAAFAESFTLGTV
jgi:hypothetical protein